MTKFLIATHGHLANGFKSTISIIMGEELADKITTLNLFVEDCLESLDAKSVINQYFDSITDEEQVIVFTDLMQGSVNQFIIPYVNDEKVYVISGINLPLMCEIMAMYGYTDTRVENSVFESIISCAQKEIIYVNDYVKNKTINEDDKTFFD